MNGGAVWGIFIQTYRVTIRSKWLLLFALVFFFFAFNIPFLSLSLGSTIPARNVPNFIQLVIGTSFSLMPLLSLPIGAVSIVEERESGSLAYIFSTPTSRGKFLIARALGLYAATTSIIVLGFTLATVIAFKLTPASFQMWHVVEAAMILNAVVISLSLVVSTLSRKRLTAYGAAIFIWFLLTYAGDTSLSGSVLAAANQYLVLIPTIFLNPIEVSRLIAVWALNTNAQGQLVLATADLNSSGQALIYVFGTTGAYYALLVTMAMWMTVCLAASYFIMTFQDIR